MGGVVMFLEVDLFDATGTVLLGGTGSGSV